MNYIYWAKEILVSDDVSDKGKNRQVGLGLRSSKEVLRLGLKRAYILGSLMYFEFPTKIFKTNYSVGVT